MALLEPHEISMLNHLDWLLSCDLLVWDELKAGRCDEVINLHKEINKNIALYIYLNPGDSTSAQLENQKDDISKILMDYLYAKKSKASWEVMAIEQHIMKNYSDLVAIINDKIITNSIIGILDKITHHHSIPWTTIISRQIKFSMAFDTYYSWLWGNYIKDALFYPRKRPKLVDTHTWEDWLKVRENESSLEEKIPQEEAKVIIEKWNKTTKNNYGLSGIVAGFLRDADEEPISINNELIDNAFIINIPKEIDESRFNSVICDIRTLLFTRQKPLHTIKDYLTHYLPTSVRGEFYKRQILEQRNQFLGYFTAMLCDRMYHYRKQINEGLEIHPKITSYNTAAVHANEYMKDYGIIYGTDSILKMRRKLIVDIIPQLRENFKNLN